MRRHALTEDSFVAVALVAVMAFHASDDRQFILDFERVASSTWFAVRVEAARAIATFDKKAAGRLLIREFGSRFQGACDAANRALNGLTGLNRSVNCLEPLARSEAAASWESAVNAL